MAQSKDLRVLIIGAGISGLVLAQALRKKGIPYEIFERDPTEESRTQGWTIGLHTVLEDLKQAVPGDLPAIDTVRHLQPLELESETVIYVDGKRTSVKDNANHSIRAHRRRLRKWLSTHINIQYGKRAISLIETHDSVIVNFQDGSSASGTVIVGADGGHSITRTHILGGREILQTQPIGAVVAELVLEEDALERQLTLAHSTYLTHVDLGDGSEPGRFFAGLFEVLPGCRSAKYYWFLGWKDEAAVHTDYWARSATQQQLYDYVGERLKQLDPRMREVFDRTKPEEVMRHPWIFQDLELESMPSSRVTLIGDAAHCMTPFRGEGGTHAIRDSLNLAEALGSMVGNDLDHIKNVLGAFQNEMLARGSKAVKLSRGAFGNRPSDGGPRIMLGTTPVLSDEVVVCLDDIIPADIPKEYR